MAKSIDRFVPPSPSWSQHRTDLSVGSKQKQYIVFAAEVCSSMARSMEKMNPERFRYLPIWWQKFPDETDNITLAGFSPQNEIAGENVIFLASFHNNDVTLSQFSVLIVLLQSFIESLTIVLPFYPVGTNERVEVEGRIATANTYALLLSNLPNLGKPSRIMIYDIHALQNRFYFHGATIPSLHTSLPLLFDALRTHPIQYTSIAFPDDGAAKRFGQCFKNAGFDIIVCGKVRDGLKRKVYVQDGTCQGKNIVVVDDLIQTGGTMYECGMELKAAGAARISAFVAHAVFPRQSWRHFTRGGSKDIFETFWITNSQPSVTCDIPEDDAFVVLDLLPQIIADLDFI